MKNLTNIQKAKLVCAAIAPHFGDKPEHRLMLSVVQKALMDAAGPYSSWTEKDGAKMYFKGHMPHAELCGVDSEWIRSKIEKYGMEI